MELREICARITRYLSGGGLFNPEMANHSAVRDMLIEIRCDLEAKLPAYERVVEALRLALPRMAHRSSCWKRTMAIYPRKKAKHRNVHCLCEIAKVEEALAPFTPVAQRSEDAEG
jgi:hypothetical protein